MPDPHTPKYPGVTVHLTETDGNDFALLGRCQAAMREAGISPDEIIAFTVEATAGDYDYDQLLRVCRAWLAVQ